MPRPRRLTPSYLKHTQTGRGRLVWTDHAGTRHERLLPGAFGSPGCLQAKAAIEPEIATSPIRAPGRVPARNQRQRTPPRRGYPCASTHSEAGRGNALSAGRNVFPRGLSVTGPARAGMLQ